MMSPYGLRLVSYGFILAMTSLLLEALWSVSWSFWPGLGPALWESAFLVSLVALAVVGFGTPMWYVLEESWARKVQPLVGWALGIPTVALGFFFLKNVMVSLHQPLSLSTTVWALTVWQLPFWHQALAEAALTVSESEQWAAYALGLPKQEVFWRYRVLIMGPRVLGAFFLLLQRVLGEATLLLFTLGVGARSTPLSLLIWQAYMEGHEGQALEYALVLVALLTFLAWLGHFATRRRSWCLK